MKPDILDDVQKNEESAAQKLVKTLPFPVDFAMVLNFNSVLEEKKLIDSFVERLEKFVPFLDIFNFYISDQEHVYVVAWRVNGNSSERGKAKYFEQLNHDISILIGTGDVHIKTFYCVNINSDNSIEANRCVLDIHVNSSTPLDMDFFNTITNSYSIQQKDFPVMINNRVLHVIERNDFLYIK